MHLHGPGGPYGLQRGREQGLSRGQYSSAGAASTVASSLPAGTTARPPRVSGPNSSRNAAGESGAASWATASKAAPGSSRWAQRSRDTRLRCSATTARGSPVTPAVRSTQAALRAVTRTASGDTAPPVPPMPSASPASPASSSGSSTSTLVWSNSAPEYASARTVRSPASSTASRSRNAGSSGSSGTHVPPALTTPSWAAASAKDLGTHTPTGVSGPVPSARRRAATRSAARSRSRYVQVRAPADTATASGVRAICPATSSCSRLPSSYGATGAGGSVRSSAETRAEGSAPIRSRTVRSRASSNRAVASSKRSVR